MPNVPIYNSPQSAPADLPGVRQQAPYRMMQMADIGPGETIRAGQALAQAGETGMNIATQQQILDNENKAKTFDAQHIVSNDAILHGSDDGQVKGFLSLTGQDAVNARADTIKKLQQVPTDLGQTLDNPAQQRLVQATSQIRLASAIAQVNAHADQQLKIAGQAADEARIKSGQDSAAKSYNPVTDTATPNYDQDNPEQNSAYQQGLQTIISSVRSRWGDMGEDVVKEKTQEALGKAYIATIGHMLDGKSTDLAATATAKDYFDKVKDQIPVEAADKIKVILDKNTVLAQAQSSADGITAKFGDDFQGALAEARKITDPEVREKTYALVKEYINDNEAMKSKTQRDADNNGLSIFTNGGSLRQVQSSPYWAQMSPHAQRQVEEWAKSNALHAAQMSQLDKMNDLVGYQKILQFRSDNPTGFANLDMVKTAQEQGIKAPATVKQLIDLQASFNKGDAQESAFNTAYKNARTLYQPLLMQAGIAPTPNMDKDQKAAADRNVAQFEANVQGGIQQYMKDNNGKMPDGKTLDTMIKQNMTSVFIHGTSGWAPWSSDQAKPLGLTTPDERQQAYVVSSDQLQKDNPAQYARVFNALKTQLGRAPSKREIEDRYTQMSLMVKGQ